MVVVLVVVSREGRPGGLLASSGLIHGGLRGALLAGGHGHPAPKREREAGLPHARVVLGGGGGAQ